MYDMHQKRKDAIKELDLQPNSKSPGDESVSDDDDVSGLQTHPEDAEENQPDLSEYNLFSEDTDTSQLDTADPQRSPMSIKDIEEMAIASALASVQSAAKEGTLSPVESPRNPEGEDDAIPRDPDVEGTMVMQTPVSKGSSQAGTGDVEHAAITSALKTVLASARAELEEVPAFTAPCETPDSPSSPQVRTRSETDDIEEAAIALALKSAIKTATAHPEGDEMADPNE